MTWLKEHGLISCWEDYRDLPAGVLMDARMVMHHEAVGRQRQERKAVAPGRRR